MTNGIHDRTSKDMGITKVESLQRFKDDCLEVGGKFDLKKMEEKEWGLIEQYGQCELNGVTSVEMQRAFNRKKGPSGSLPPPVALPSIHR